MCACYNGKSNKHFKNLMKPVEQNKNIARKGVNSAYDAGDHCSI